jgi:translation initiation factor 2 beta subunit (eIF-2beta)/eIF-5
MEGASSGDDLLPGALCGHSGIYQVMHRAHRVTHNVLVRARELFPRCKVCGDAVRFRLLKQVSQTKPVRAKRVRKKSAGR